MNECKQLETLIPSYLDGELSEVQAAPLRQHLLACQNCRTAAQGERALKAWFPEQSAVAVPDGFAARIARRAFAGDTGEPEATRVAGEPAPILRFVLAATSIAAAVLFVFAVALRVSDLPNTDRLQADSASPQPLEDVLRELDRVNADADRTPERGAERVNDARAWIVILALVSFLAGGSAGFVLGRGEAPLAVETGPFADYEARLSATFDLSDDQRRLFRQVLDHYRADLEAVRERHEARSASAMEPELRELGIRYRSLIRDRVLPDNKRPLFDALDEENTRILTEAP